MHCFLLEVPSASAFDSNDLLDDDLPQPSVFRQEREEPEKIKTWREEQKKRLEEKGGFPIILLNHCELVTKQILGI